MCHFYFCMLWGVRAMGLFVSITVWNLDYAHRVGLSLNTTVFTSVVVIKSFSVFLGHKVCFFPFVTSFKH